MRFVVVALALVALVVTGIGVFYWSLSESIDEEIAALQAAAQSPDPSIVTDEMIAGLPATAQRYLRYAGVVGIAIPKLVHLTQKGRIRSGADAQWMTFEADEIYSIKPPALVWRAAFPVRATPIVLGRDIYLDGKGGILMKMLAVLPVADEHGDELRAAGLMRYLNEVAWFPAALLGVNMKILERDEQSFIVRLEDQGLVAEGIVFVDETGRMTNFQAQRFNTATRSVQTWETPITDYAEYQGFNLPRSGSALWRSPEGDLTYIELDVLTVRYEN
jgi:hypothetical protein